MGYLLSDEVEKKLMNRAILHEKAWLVLLVVIFSSYNIPHKEVFVQANLISQVAYISFT